MMLPRYPRAPAALPFQRDPLGEDSWLRSKGLGLKVWGLGRLGHVCNTDRVSQWHKVDRDGKRRERETRGRRDRLVLTHRHKQDVKRERETAREREREGESRPRVATTKGSSLNPYTQNPNSEDHGHRTLLLKASARLCRYLERHTHARLCCL